MQSGMSRSAGCLYHHIDAPGLLFFPLPLSPPRGLSGASLPLGMDRFRAAATSLAEGRCLSLGGSGGGACRAASRLHGNEVSDQHQSSHVAPWAGILPSSSLLFPSLPIPFRSPPLLLGPSCSLVLRSPPLLFCLFLHLSSFPFTTFSLGLLFSLTSGRTVVDRFVIRVEPGRGASRSGCCGRSAQQLASGNREEISLHALPARIIAFARGSPRRIERARHPVDR
jgi:hypothetical protein